jgi:hypothetical protein
MQAPGHAAAEAALRSPGVTPARALAVIAVPMRIA